MQTHPNGVMMDPLASASKAPMTIDRVFTQENIARARKAIVQMIQIREFEDSLAALFSSGAIMGTAHFCVGQEAVAVGACAAIRHDDYVVSNHRGHGHFIAKGGDLYRMFAEILGKRDGFSGGRGGSQHMSDLSCGFLGSNGITGGGIPIAAGASFASKYFSLGRVVVSFFGDGAANQGTFHETLNMAALWQLPVVFLCENNQYAMSTPVAQSSATGAISDRALSYGMRNCRIDGNDFFAVTDAVAGAAEWARSGKGPTLVEAITYRRHGHSRSDRCEYRSSEEEAYWGLNDPIDRLRTWLLAGGVAGAEIDEIALQARSAVASARDLAIASINPDPSTVCTGLWSDSATTGSP
jgi:TPP-dependent pyruvate/acetoin dehydrogenase alpha subunit